jgi:hydrocephalus-inducing protein
MEERIKGEEEQKEEVKGAKGKKPEPAKPALKGKDAKGKDAPPEGGLIEVTQYSITPATGSIPPGNAAIVNVTFKAKGAKFYESTLAIDIANRDPTDQPDGIPFELCAESSIPGINTDDMDQIFEE